MSTIVVSPLEIARRASGLTQRELAARCGVARETISRVECGDAPRLRTARAIARALNTSVDAILPAAAIASHNDEAAPGKGRDATTSTCLLYTSPSPRDS